MEPDRPGPLQQRHAYLRRGHGHRTWAYLQEVESLGGMAIAAARARIEEEVTAGKLPPTQAAQEIIDVMERDLFHAGR